MSTDGYRRDVERYRNEIAKLQETKSREAEAAAKESARAHAAADAAARASSPPTARSKARDSQRYSEAAVARQKNVANLEGKIARAHQQVNTAEKHLAASIQADDKKRMAALTKTEREHNDRLRGISGTLTHHADLHKVAASALKQLSRLPPQVTVLFFAANPIDQEQLRLDEEARAIGEMIRKAEHRDAVKLESRWAVRPLDLLQAINECDPRIVHFSGHGSVDEELAFQDSSGATKLVSKEALAQTLAASSSNIQLVFFNVCYSKAQAEAVVQHVPAAIGMNTAIGDDAAPIFAAQFYSAIGFGLSVGKAFAQGKAALMLEGIAEELTPELFLTPGLDQDALVLVKADPSAHGA